MFMLVVDVRQFPFRTTSEYLLSDREEGKCLGVLVVVVLTSSITWVVVWFGYRSE